MFYGSSTGIGLPIQTEGGPPLWIVENPAPFLASLIRLYVLFRPSQFLEYPPAPCIQFPPPQSIFLPLDVPSTQSNPYHLLLILASPLQSYPFLFYSHGPPIFTNLRP